MALGNSFRWGIPGGNAFLCPWARNYLVSLASPKSIPFIVLGVYFAVFLDARKSDFLSLNVLSYALPGFCHFYGPFLQKMVVGLSLGHKNHVLAQFSSKLNFIIWEFGIRIWNLRLLKSSLAVTCNVPSWSFYPPFTRNLKKTTSKSENWVRNTPS